MLAEHFRRWIMGWIRLDEIYIDKLIECEAKLNDLEDLKERVFELEKIILKSDVSL
jgi:hypothetical protein